MMERDEAIRRAGQHIAEAIALLLDSGHAPPATPSQPVGWVVGESDRVYLSTAEVAERLGLSQGSLRGWRSTGTGPPCVKFGGRVMYPVDELQQWEAEQRRGEATAQRRRGSGFVHDRTNRAQKL